MLPGARLRQIAVPALAAVLAFCACSLAAQSFDFAHDRQPMISLNGLWRFHPGDSPIVNGAPLGQPRVRRFVVGHAAQ